MKQLVFNMLTIFVFALLVGCTNVPSSMETIPQSRPIQSVTGTPMPTSTGSLPPVPTARPKTDSRGLPDPQNTTSMQEQVVADLAKRLEIDSESISVVTITSEELPASDLGCPGQLKLNGPTKAEPSSFVMGQVIRLSAGQSEYEYHARGSEWVFCGAQ